MRGPFESAPFRWLAAARFTTVLGNAVAPLALAFAVLDLTGSPSDLGLVVACRSVANVAVLLFGGVLADRFSRTVLLTGTSVAAGLSQGVIAALVLSGTATIPLLAGLSVVNGAVAAVSFPASAALVPSTVGTEQLRSANSILRLGVNAGTLVSAAAGSVMIAVVGPGWGLAFDAFTFLVAAALFTRIRVAGSVRAKDSGSSMLRDLRDGWQEFSRRSWVWVVVVQFMVVNAAFVGAIAVLGPLVADRTFGRASWGLIIASETAGLVLGSLLALRWRPSRALGTGVVLVAVTALPAVMLALRPSVPVLMACFAVGGIAIEQFGVAWDQSLQQHIPGEKLARVYSYDAVGSFLAIPLGEVLVGPLAATAGTTPVLLGAGSLIVLATLGAACVPSVWRTRNVRAAVTA
ncbi:MAG TPA: MFS transporter [Lacisediminihabitans sp.]|uniref:MFS transporter n=1 Tax=Lacisediminihabitans sp. TaxID=2787631 RepID=UPI002ED89A48